MNTTICLNMPLSSLTAEKVLGLQEEAVIKDKELEITRATSPSDLWRQDLDKLEPQLRKSHYIVSTLFKNRLIDSLLCILPIRSYEFIQNVLRDSR